PFLHQTTIPPNTDVLIGGRAMFGQLLALPTDALVPTFSLFGLWFLLRLVLRRPLPAALGLAVVLTLLSLGAENPLLEVPGALFPGALTAWVIARYGLLGLIASWLVRLLLQITPLPVAATSPYAFQTILCLAALLVLVAWAFRVSLGGRPVFALDD